jgi:multidrug efflux pump subunit AcrA (membrane-fusion protein)
LTDESKTDGLPRHVLRPLYGSALTVLCFTGGVLLWAVFAPLASTLSLSGHMVSERAAVLVQHAYGGPVAQVHVKRHDYVDAGTHLLTLDTSVEQQQAQVSAEMLQELAQQNEVISQLLSAGHAELPGITEYHLQRQQALLQRVTKRQSAQNMKEQAQALLKKISYTEEQLIGMQARSDRQLELVRKGLLKRDAGEALQEQILIVRAELQGDRVDLAALNDRRRQVQAEAEMVFLDVRQRLTAVHRRNEGRMQELHRTLLALEDQIERAEVRAPVGGMVTELHLEAQDSYAARGATLVALAQPLDRPHVVFTVPVSYIDQLNTGMTGRLVLPSLPQRAMPVVDVTITAISPRAALDDHGQLQGYTGRAELSVEAAQKLQDALDIGQLSEDMPVQLIVTVRDTTLARYLLDPFMSAFANALQD